MFAVVVVITFIVIAVGKCILSDATTILNYLQTNLCDNQFFENV